MLNTIIVSLIQIERLNLKVMKTDAHTCNWHYHACQTERKYALSSNYSWLISIIATRSGCTQWQVRKIELYICLQDTNQTQTEQFPNIDANNSQILQAITERKTYTWSTQSRIF